MTGQVKKLRPNPPRPFSTTDVADALGDHHLLLQKTIVTYGDLLRDAGIIGQRRGPGNHHRLDRFGVVVLAAIFDLHDPEPVLIRPLRERVLYVVLSATWGQGPLVIHHNDRLTTHYTPRWELPAEIEESRA